MKFQVEFLEEAEVFIDNLSEKTRTKVLYNIKKSQYITDSDLLKKLNANIWEFRTIYLKQTIRLFAFWTKKDNKETLVICTHGIIKKTQKTPKQEIEKAEKIRKRYLNL